VAHEPYKLHLLVYPHRASFPEYDIIELHRTSTKRQCQLFSGYQLKQGKAAPGKKVAKGKTTSKVSESKPATIKGYSWLMSGAPTTKVYKSKHVSQKGWVKPNASDLKKFLGDSLCNSIPAEWSAKRTATPTARSRPKRQKRNK
jgi:hypothetical protein